jgi:hypothetical protein
MEILPADALVGRVMSKEALIDAVLKPRARPEARGPG